MGSPSRIVENGRGGIAGQGGCVNVHAFPCGNGALGLVALYRSYLLIQASLIERGWTNIGGAWGGLVVFVCVSTKEMIVPYSISGFAFVQHWVGCKGRNHGWSKGLVDCLWGRGVCVVMKWHCSGWVACGEVMVAAFSRVGEVAGRGSVGLVGVFGCVCVHKALKKKFVGGERRKSSKDAQISWLKEGGEGGAGRAGREESRLGPLLPHAQVPPE